MKSLLHDLSNALQPIFTGVELIQSHLREVQETIDDMGNAVVSIQELVGRMNARSGQVEAYTATVKHPPLLVSDRIKVLMDGMPALEQQFKLRVGISNDCSSDCAILSDPNLTTEITTKLLENASKAGASNVRIHYHACKGDEECQVEVTFTDDGCGMTSSELSHMGFSGDNGGPSGGKGVRLVRELISKCGGTVEWFSRKGVGTTVTITLRRAKATGNA